MKAAVARILLPVLAVASFSQDTLPAAPEVDTAVAPVADTVVAAPDTAAQGDAVMAADTAASGAEARSIVEPAAEEDIFFIEIEVTATKPRPLRESPVSVTVITREEIEASPAKSIDDLMVNTKGLVLKRSVGMGEGIPADINMRGIPSTIAATRTLILVDGIPTNVSGTPLLIINEVPLEAVERIEIVRGPYSCLYGANAFGGAINIRTRLPKDKPRVEVYGDVGNMVYWQGAVWSGGSWGDLAYSVNGGLRGIANYFAWDSVLLRRDTGDTYISSENYDYEDRRFFARAEYPIRSDLTLKLNLRYFQSSLGYGSTRFITPAEEMINAGRKGLAAPFMTWSPSPDLEVTAGGFYRKTIGEFYGQSILSLDSAVWIPSYWKAISDDYQGQARLSIRLGGKHLLITGFESLLNDIHFLATVDRKTRQPVWRAQEVKKSFNNTGIYIQDESSFADRFLVVPGIRADYHSGYHWTLSPKIGVQFQAAAPLSLRTSFGRGFRAPTTSELYLPDMAVNAASVLISNPDLKPEYVWAGDGGGVLTLFANRLTAQCDGFYNQMEDLIIPAIIDKQSQDVYKVTFKNTARARSFGVESDIEVRAFKFLTLFGNHTYTETEDEATGDPLDYIPLHKWNTGARANLAWGDWSLEGSIMEDYTGERSYLDWGKWDIVINALDRSKPVRYVLPPYWRTDLGLKGAYKDRFWAGVSAQNIFNEIFEESGGNLAPGRLISLRAGVAF